MFQFFTKIKEYNNLAKSLNGICVMHKSVDSQANIFNRHDHFENLICMAYIYKKGVKDRLEKYSWPLDSKIVYLPLAKIISL